MPRRAGGAARRPGCCAGGQDCALLVGSGGPIRLGPHGRTRPARARQSAGSAPSVPAPRPVPARPPARVAIPSQPDSDRSSDAQASPRPGLASGIRAGSRQLGSLQDSAITRAAGNQRGSMLAAGNGVTSGGRRANGRRRRPAGLTKAGTARGSPPHAPAGSCPDSAEPLRSCEVECSSRTPQGHGQGPSFGPCGDRRSSGRRAAAPAPREPHAESQAGVARRLAGPTPPIRQPGGGTARKLAVASVTFL